MPRRPKGSGGERRTPHCTVTPLFERGIRAPSVKENMFRGDFSPYKIKRVVVYCSKSDEKIFSKSDVLKILITSCSCRRLSFDQIGITNFNANAK